MSLFGGIGSRLGRDMARERGLVLIATLLVDLSRQFFLVVDRMGCLSIRFTPTLLWLYPPVEK